MPIVPVFGGGGGSSPTPSPAVRQWLDLPTQTVQLASSATGNITLNTPTNGFAPFRYEVVPTYLGPNATLTVSGNVLEISNTAVLSTSITQGSSTAYRVIVFDSVGNYGVGALILWTETGANYTFAPVIEQVVEWDEQPNGVVFAARTPVGTETAYRPSGDGFSYPRPVTTPQVEGERLMNTPPGGFLVNFYMRNLGSSTFQLVCLVLRRKMNVYAPNGSWLKSPDFISWPDVATIAPTIPLSTVGSTTPSVEANSENGKSYAMERITYARTAGLTPTAETCVIDSGAAEISTYNTVSSTRIVAFVLRPATPGVVANSQREASMSRALGGMMRVKARVTLDGNYSFAEVMLGQTYTSSSPSSIGLRFQGPSSTVFSIAGQPAIKISANIGGSLRQIGWYRRSVFAGSDFIGIDIISLGGVNYVTVYPWDSSWTDFPDYDDDRFNLSVDGCIGPVPVLVNAVGISTSARYAGNLPTYYNSNTVTNASIHWGVVGAVGQGNNGSGGATLEMSKVEYYWKTMNLGAQE
jgi:hypothetical protein